MKTNWPALRHGYLILASMTLANSPVLAQTPEPAVATATAAVISSVAITQPAACRTRIAWCWILRGPGWRCRRR